MSLTLKNSEDTEMSFSSILKVLYTFGVPALIALFLVWSNVAGTTRDLAEIKASQVIHTAQSTEQAKTNGKLEMKLEQMTNILQNICANTAKNQSERNGCFNLQGK